MEKKNLLEVEDKLILPIPCENSDPSFDEMRTSVKECRVGELIYTDRIMNDTFWVGVYPGINNEMIDYMGKIIKEAVKEAVKNGIKVNLEGVKYETK